MKKTLINKAASLLGKKGGQSKSKAKISAARENGKKGGRPKKIKPNIDTYQDKNILGTYNLL